MPDDSPDHVRFSLDCSLGKGLPCGRTLVFEPRLDFLEGAPVLQRVFGMALNPWTRQGHSIYRSPSRCATCFIGKTEKLFRSSNYHESDFRLCFQNKVSVLMLGKYPFSWLYLLGCGGHACRSLYMISRHEPPGKGCKCYRIPIW